MDKLKFKIIRNVSLAILIVIVLNLIVLFLTGFPAMAILQIKKYFILLILLVSGFGIQIGLYTYLKHINLFCSATTMASGGISSISMILCCSHYLLNFLPFISISAVTLLAKYTFQILLFGVLSNLFGISIMINKIRKIKFGGKK